MNRTCQDDLLSINTTLKIQLDINKNSNLIN